MIPELETSRLRLRAHRPGDFPASLAMWSDPLVVRCIGGKPSTPQQAWARLMTYAGLWEFLGYGYWAVEEKASGLMIGDIGFADFKRDLVPSIQGVPEAGWALMPKAHGKGFATEALKAVLAWGDVRFAKARTVCIIQPDNFPSIRVAEKCGFREETRTTYNGQPTILLSRTPT